MTDAYSALDDDYQAHKLKIRKFNSDLEQKLAEAEDEELAAILSTFATPPTTKLLTIPKQQEDSD